jgi:glutaryl-CoA dehydrogenase
VGTQTRARASRDAAGTAPPLRPGDFLDVDALLDDEERLIRDTVRSFVSDRVLPHVGEWFEEARLPPELGPELGKLGLLGMHLEGYGCAGASATAYGLTCLQLAARDSGLRHLV